MRSMQPFPMNPYPDNNPGNIQDEWEPDWEDIDE